MARARILLIISGGIAAYKSLELIRSLRSCGYEVTPVLTKSGAEFVTPLSVSALCGQAVHQELFDFEREAQMGHIELSRAADLIVVAPATANILAKMAQGLADDLATTLLLATNKPVLIAPAMNVQMWEHPATQRNVAQLGRDGVFCVPPATGLMACGEFGAGRLAALEDIMTEIDSLLAGQSTQEPLQAGALHGKHVLVTSGPTHEPIDPVRYIANRSSGEQGAQIARAALALGARVSFITGPADVPPPEGVEVSAVQTAQEMLEAVQKTLPADIAICAAAVADWRVDNASAQKMKKNEHGLPELQLSKNPDILQHIAQHDTMRPDLVIGFAAETENVASYAQAKLLRKGCDWIVANDVSEHSGVMGGVDNEVTLFMRGASDGVVTSESWPRMSKAQTAQQLIARIAQDTR